MGLSLSKSNNWYQVRPETTRFQSQAMLLLPQMDDDNVCWEEHKQFNILSFPFPHGEDEKWPLSKWDADPHWHGVRPKGVVRHTSRHDRPDQHSSTVSSKEFLHD